MDSRTLAEADAAPELMAARAALTGLIDRQCPCAPSAGPALRGVVETLERTGVEIAALAPGALSDQRIPMIGDELEAIRRDSADAFERILAAAETLLKARSDDPERYAALVAAEAMAIVEACCVDDITSQRVSRAQRSLSVVGARVAAFAQAMGAPEAEGADETVAERHAREQLLSGPADHRVAQADIDRAFAAAGR